MLQCKGLVNRCPSRPLPQTPGMLSGTCYPAAGSGHPSARKQLPLPPWQTNKRFPKKLHVQWRYRRLLRLWHREVNMMITATILPLLLLLPLTHLLEQLLRINSPRMTMASACMLLPGACCPSQTSSFYIPLLSHPEQKPHVIAAKQCD